MRSLILLLALAAPARADRVYTLADARRLALLNDPRVLSAEQDKIIASEREREALYLFFPEVGVQASATKFNAQYPFSLSNEFRNILLFPDFPNPYGARTDTLYSGRTYATMSLFEGGRTINTLRLAKAATKQADSALEAAKLDTVASVTEVFYRLILAQERMSAASEYEAAVEQVLTSPRIDPWERVEAEARLSKARSQASEAQHALSLARLTFLKSINVELDTEFSVTGDLQTKAVQLDVDKAILRAMELRPELQSETYRAQMDAISVNLAAARRIPTVYVSGDYEVTNDGFPLDRTNWDATVGVKIPFSYDYFTQLRQKRAEQRQGQLKRAELQDRVRLEVRQAYENLSYWQKEWPAREERYRKIQALYDAAAKQGGSAVGRVRALSGVLELKLDYLTAVTEQILAVARLERAIGGKLSP